MQEHLYQLDTTSIFGVSVGTGTPVICMHGITGNAYVFEPIAKKLAANFHVVSIDQRGHGRSGRPDRYEGEDYAADVAALIEHLDCGPAILLGHSLGARNAFVAANRYPEHVAAVVALDFTPFIEPEVLTQLEERVVGGYRSFASIEEIKSYLAGRYPLLPADAIDRRAYRGYKETSDGWWPLADNRAMQLTAAGLKGNLEDAVASLKQPAILVRGAVSKLVSEDAWRKTQQLRPDIEAIQIEGSDHYIPEVKPLKVAECVMRFQ
ncbi:MAG TPA: alpha/beta hydrolase [Eoetvoesiella sp.]